MVMVGTARRRAFAHPTIPAPGIRTGDSKLAVESSRENRHRAAIGVVGGVGDELVIGGQRDLLVQRVGVIGLEDALAPVVERAVADQDAETAGGDEVAV